LAIPTDDFYRILFTTTAALSVVSHLFVKSLVFPAF
jgi:hypothetical protein